MVLKFRTLAQRICGVERYGLCQVSTWLKCSFLSFSFFSQMAVDVILWRHSLTASCTVLTKIVILLKNSYSVEEFVNYSPAVRDLRILLMFFQHPAWFISL